MRRKTKAALALAVAAAFAMTAWVAAPLFVEDPLAGLAPLEGVKIWRDMKGREVWYERAASGAWLFPVTLDEISPEARELMLAAEDARFYSHDGVDYLAALRALWQNIVHLRKVSGASTISMQVADLANSGRRRGLWRKFVQAAKARKMERLHAKDEILEAYFNRVSYGGQIYGIEAASLYYFGRHASELTRTDATLLCGIPQAPNRLRPDRHPDAAKRRFELVLRQLVRQGALSRDEALSIFDSAHLAYRDFSLPAAFILKGEAREWSLCTNHLATMDSELTLSLRQMLARRVAAVEGVNDAAAVLVHIPSGDVRAYVGTIDFHSRDAGEVDAAKALRSAGSVLKPFIYLEAMKAGFITAATVLEDAPARWGDYAPKNYDGAFRSAVTVREALARSLNLPAVRLVARLGAKRVAEAFDALGLKTDAQKTDNGLSLALGSAGYRLVDIVRAYARMVREDTREVREICSILSTYPLQGTELPLAWKTGTSNNHCDAWCVAFDREWVVGVWFGNKSGAKSANLVGAEIAAPAAAEIMELVCDGSLPEQWQIASVPSGGGVGVLGSGMFDAGNALRAAIVSPAPKRYVPDWGEDRVELDFRANRTDLYWYCDGEGIGANPGRRSFTRGRHHVCAVPPSGPLAEVVFTVE